MKAVEAAAAMTNLQPPTRPARGDALLLHHVLAVGGTERRPSAQQRLADALGSELAELLVGALQERRGSSSP